MQRQLNVVATDRWVPSFPEPIVPSLKELSWPRPHQSEVHPGFVVGAKVWSPQQLEQCQSPFVVSFIMTKCWNSCNNVSLSSQPTELHSVSDSSLTTLSLPAWWRPWNWIRASSWPTSKALKTARDDNFQTSTWLRRQPGKLLLVLKWVLANWWLNIVKHSQLFQTERMTQQRQKTIVVAWYFIVFIHLLKIYSPNAIKIQYIVVTSTARMIKTVKLFEMVPQLVQ